MEDILILKIIDWTKMYWMQAIGIIVIILLSRVIIQLLLHILGLIMTILFILLKGLFTIIQLILSILPGSLQEKMNRFILKVESFIRTSDQRTAKMKEWFDLAPDRYVKVHEGIVKVVKTVVILYFAVSAIVFIVNVFIQKAITLEQLIAYFG